MDGRLEKAKRKYLLYFYQAIRNIACVCVIREENFDKMGLIEYNLSRVSSCLKELYKQDDWSLCSTNTPERGQGATLQQLLDH